MKRANQSRQSRLALSALALSALALSALALSAIGALTGCSSTGSDMLKGSDLLKAPAGLAASGAQAVAGMQLPKLEVPNIEVPKLEGPPVGSPIEIYTRIGRGAGICWFGPHGELKPNYIFHAEAAPESRGGQSEIIIHEKDLRMPNPRGNRAFRVQIIPNGENATVEIENIRFPIETGQRMTADVNRWARDDLTCHETAHTKGWDANAAPAPAAPPPPKSAKTRERKT